MANHTDGSMRCNRRRELLRVAGVVAARRRMRLAPMLGDVAAGAEPDAVAFRRIVEELDQPRRLAWPADQPVMQRHAHDLRPLGAFLVEQIEAIDHVSGEFVGGAEAGVAVETVVVGFERIGDDEVIVIAHANPEGQLVAEIVAVVPEAAMLDQEPARIDARPAVEPADGRRAGQLLDRGDGALDMLALLVFLHLVIIEPAPAMADDLVSVFDEGASQFGAHIQAADDAEHADFHAETLEDAQQPPAADARPVFEDRFDQRATPAGISWKADIGEQVLRMRVALQDRMLAAGLDIEIEIDGDPRVARPARVRRVGAVAEKVARRARVGAPRGWRSRDLAADNTPGIALAQSHPLLPPLCRTGRPVSFPRKRESRGAPREFIRGLPTSETQKRARSRKQIPNTAVPSRRARLRAKPASPVAPLRFASLDPRPPRWPFATKPFC